jgi:hypothetical protein
MSDGTAETSTMHDVPQPRLRVVGEPTRSRDAAPSRRAARGDELSHALRAAEDRVSEIAARVERVRGELALVRADVARRPPVVVPLPDARLALRASVGVLGIVLLGFALWARSVDYALRVTSDTPTFLTLVTDMAHAPFASQSPFLAGGGGTQHATPYMQALAAAWALVGAGASPIAIGRFLALVGIVVFAFALWCVFLYVRRLAGSTAAWVSVPVLLAVLGPPHVIWASDLSFHGALYAGFFPQTLAIGTTLLALLSLERASTRSLVGACALTTVTMLVHPFTGVLLAVLATTESCQRAARRDRSAARAPIALASGFLAGCLWPAYSLDRAFAETGLRGIVFIALCVAAPAATWAAAPRVGGGSATAAVGRLLESLSTPTAAFRLAVAGAVGTCAVAVWEWMLVASPPDESARLAVYWVDERWRWPILLIAGASGLAGLARLAARGSVVPGVWFAGCFGVGALGALGLPLPVWYRFLLLCQVPLAAGVATVVAEARAQPRTVALVAATVVVSLGVKVASLVWTADDVSYFGQPLQPVWSLSTDIPRGPGLVATDPATAYFIPATTGRRVLTVDKGHVSSRAELARSADGYRLLRRFYAGGPGWWSAAQEMWRKGVRYVVVSKTTTLEPAELQDFIWQTARLETAAQRRALGTYYYENNRVGTLVFDSPDYAVFRLSRSKLFGRGGSS